MEKENSNEIVKAGKRTYFLDIKSTKEDKKYLKITESKQNNGEFERHQIMIFQEDIKKFSEAFIRILLKLNIEESESDKEKIKTKLQKDLPDNSYQPWTKKDDEALELLFCQGKTSKELATFFKRKVGAINSRIKKLELKEKYND